MLRVLCTFFAATAFSLPALADSYAVVNFSTPSPSLQAYVTPYASFYGGTVAGSATAGYDYEAYSSNVTHAGLGFNIYIQPGFGVEEVRFRLDYEAPSFASIEADALGPGPGGFTYEYLSPGIHTVDLLLPTGITSFYVDDQGYTPQSFLSIADVEFNPSLSPSGVTPELPSVWLLGSAFMISAFYRRLRSGFPFAPYGFRADRS